MYDYEYIYRSFSSGDITPFYENLYPGLLVYAARQLGDDLAYLAEDCVQDAVINSYAERHKFGSSMAWYSYILKCIFHSSVDLVRKHRSHSDYIGSREADELTPELDMAILEQETLDLLYEAIESLPPKYREILKMSYLEGIKNSEIAERLGVAEITVKKQKAKLLAMLRDRLKISYPLLFTLLSEYYACTCQITPPQLI